MPNDWTSRLTYWHESFGLKNQKCRIENAILHFLFIPNYTLSNLAGRPQAKMPVFPRIFPFYHKFFDLSIENLGKFFPKIYIVQNGGGTSPR